MITVFAATSGGHLNPAVTVGLLVGGKIKAGPAAGYIAAQVLGGELAGLAVLGILPHDAAALAVIAGLDPHNVRATAIKDNPPARNAS